MLGNAIGTAEPFLQFVSKGNNPITIFISESTNKCKICEKESNTLYVLTYNFLACQVCFDFIVSCNYFNDSEPIKLIN